MREYVTNFRKVVANWAIVNMAQFMLVAIMPDVLWVCIFSQPLLAVYYNSVLTFDEDCV